MKYLIWIFTLTVIYFIVIMGTATVYYQKATSENWAGVHQYNMATFYTNQSSYRLGLDYRKQHDSCKAIAEAHGIKGQYYKTKGDRLLMFIPKFLRPKY